MMIEMDYVNLLSRLFEGMKMGWLVIFNIFFVIIQFYNVLSIVTGANIINQ